MKPVSFILILTAISFSLLAQSEELSFLDRQEGIKSANAEYHLGDNPVEPDSTHYARAAIVANDLLNVTIDKLRALSNIDENGTAISNYDKIITFDNEVLVVKVQHITLTEVSFLYPFNTSIQSINRQKVSQILYADNRIDLFTPFEEENKKLLPLQEDRLIVYRRELWERIIITENRSDVNGF